MPGFVWALDFGVEFLEQIPEFVRREYRGPDAATVAKSEEK